MAADLCLSIRERAEPQGASLPHSAHGGQGQEASIAWSTQVDDWEDSGRDPGEYFGRWTDQVWRPWQVLRLALCLQTPLLGFLPCSDC